MSIFKLVSKFNPAGDQPAGNLKVNSKYSGWRQTPGALGVTGSGKTFTVANMIEKIQRPTLVISHNKTLAAQLYQEFKEFFPEKLGALFCFLLRLLPARSLHSPNRHLHRKGRQDQRRTGPFAPRGHPIPAFTAWHIDRFFRFLDL